RHLACPSSSGTAVASTRALVFFFFLFRRPPRSPLFPYTTLFRSENRPPGPFEAQCDGLLRRMAGTEFLADAFVDEHVGVNGHAQDRKSTRLNSSHVKISYAVFCLKKKKKETGQKYGHGRHCHTRT